MSAGDVFDPLPAILAALNGNVAVSNACSANPASDPRIWGEKIPADSPMSSPRNTEYFAAMVGVVGAGGSVYERAIVSYPRYELRAYHPAGEAAARTLFYIAMNALNERTLMGVDEDDNPIVIGYASFAADMGGTMPYPNADPPTGTPYYYAYFGVVTYARNR